MKPEARAQEDIKHLMRDILGFACWDMSQDRKTRQTPGIPDCIFMGYGHVLFVEVKAGKGKESPAQSEFRETCMANGGLSLVWYGVGDAKDWVHREGIVKLHQEAIQ